MKPEPAVGEAIREFLSHKRLAVVGVSRNPRGFSRMLYSELRKRGYDVVPVNPGVGDVDGQPCFARVQDVTPPVDGALLMTRPDVTDRVVHDCATAGVKRIWMYQATGRGAVSRTALDFCAQKEISVIPGFCPYMFLPNAGFIHRFHGFVKKLTGSYPA